MENSSSKYLLIADAHLAGEAEEKQFFDLLKEAESLPPSVGIVFLGDIFELWIALDQYESEEHRRFLQWCRNEKTKREILFTEGNHEFYAVKYRDVFTKITGGGIRMGELLFTHGDRINRKDVPYLLLRLGVRNSLTKFLLYLTGPAFGPGLSHRVRLGLKTTNMVHKKNFPADDLSKMMDRAAKRGIREIFIGHFHDEREFSQNGVRVHALPAFLNTFSVGRYDTATGEYAVGAWRDVLAGLKTTTEKNS